MERPAARINPIREREVAIINDLLARFKTRGEQVAEWTRLTGKCRRTFEIRHRQASGKAGRGANA